jgi:hypothetical protein
MATPQTQIPKALEEALAKLRHDPSRPVRAHLDELDVELRAVEKPKMRLGDFMAEGGGWKGESAEEISRIIREARAAGTSSEPPKL